MFIGLGLPCFRGSQSALEKRLRQEELRRRRSDNHPGTHHAPRHGVRPTNLVAVYRPQSLLPERPFVAAPPHPPIALSRSSGMFLGLLWKRVFVKKGFVGDGVVMVAAHVSKAARTSANRP